MWTPLSDSTLLNEPNVFSMFSTWKRETQTLVKELEWKI